PPKAGRRPSGLNAASLCPGTDSSPSPLAVSHTRTTSSPPALASHLPSGLTDRGRAAGHPGQAEGEQFLAALRVPELDAVLSDEGPRQAGAVGAERDRPSLPPAVLAQLQRGELFPGEVPDLNDRADDLG